MFAVVKMVFANSYFYTANLFLLGMPPPPPTAVHVCCKLIFEIEENSKDAWKAIFKYVHTVC